MQNHFVYILETAKGPYYIGYTTDIEKRMRAHRSGKGSKFVRAFKFGQLLYQERHLTKSGALKREAEIKKWDRSQKETLIFGKEEGYGR
ncbi:MAG: GIY-YIG nuclease family protein [Deltaproteobacteria bacterium]|nr:GIY-YIG nuclease family protein [Deltaproteobacteria bacterium]